MGTQKEPLDVRTLTRIEAIAESDKFGRESDTYKMFVILRYTGAHESVIVNPKCGMHEEQDNDDETVIVWLRPKKKGPWARTWMPKSQKIKFNVTDYLASIQKRTRKNTRQYVYRKIQELGLEAGITRLAPMSLRHSLAVQLINEGWPEVLIAQVLNVTPRMLKFYARFTTIGIKEKFKKMGW